MLDLGRLRGTHRHLQPAHADRKSGTLNRRGRDNSDGGRAWLSTLSKKRGESDLRFAGFFTFSRNAL